MKWVSLNNIQTWWITVHKGHRNNRQQQQQHQSLHLCSVTNSNCGNKNKWFWNSNIIIGTNAFQTKVQNPLIQTWAKDFYDYRNWMLETIVTLMRCLGLVRTRRRWQIRLVTTKEISFALDDDNFILTTTLLIQLIVSWPRRRHKMGTAPNSRWCHCNWICRHCLVSTVPLVTVQPIF